MSNKKASFFWTIFYQKGHCDSSLNPASRVSECNFHTCLSEKEGKPILDPENFTSKKSFCSCCAIYKRQSLSCKLQCENTVSRKCEYVWGFGNHT